MDHNTSDTGKNVLERCVSDCEKMVIIHALTRTRGNQSGAAEILGTTRRSLAHKIHKYGINCQQFK